MFAFPAVAFAGAVRAIDAVVAFVIVAVAGTVILPLSEVASTRHWF